MRNCTIIILLVLLLFINPVSAQEPWCGLNTGYFQHDPLPDIPGYEQFQNYPSGNPEIDENVTILAASGLVLIDTYLTPEGLPAAYALEPGLRRYRTYHYVDKDQGDTRFVFKPFLYHTDGSTTPLYEIMTGEIDATEPTEYLTSYVIANRTEIDPTDRIGISVYTNTTSSTTIYSHFIYEGTTHHSHVELGFYSCEPPAPAPTIPNLPAAPMINDESLTFIGWAILIVLAFLALLRLLL